MNYGDVSTAVSTKDKLYTMRRPASTAERYLDELEKEGKITQVGKTGKHVYYQIAE